jgi:preprotein translocase subunit SecG
LVAALIGVILLQKSEGGALGLGGSGGGGGMGGFMTARGSANLLTRTTGILAVLFFLSTIILALMVKGTHKEKSILIEDDSRSAAQSAESVPGTSPSQPQADETKKQGQ